MSSGATDEPQSCTPCRGTGRLVSGLGGEPHEVPCPWCGGTGRRDPGRNAQEHAPADPAGGVESSSAGG